MLDKGIAVYEQQHAITNSRTFRFFINNEKFETMKRFQVKDNDLIISCSGTVGCVSIIGPDDPKGIISQALLILRANTDIASLQTQYTMLTLGQVKSFLKNFIIYFFRNTHTTKRGCKKTP